MNLKLISAEGSDDDPILARHRIFTLYNKVKDVIDILCNNKFFQDNDNIEFTGKVFSRIGHDSIQLIGLGDDIDLSKIALEYETLS